MHPLPNWLVIALAFVPAQGLAQAAPADVDRRIEQEREFMQMTPAEEPAVACAFDRPPEDLAETAYLRNGYEAMRRILAMEMWQETGSCACFYDDVTYEQAITASERFVVSSDPQVPFRVYDMQQTANELIARHAEACDG